MCQHYEAKIGVVSCGGINKIKAMAELGEEFKEFRIGYVREEIKKIEELLKKVSRLGSNEEDIKTYKALKHKKTTFLRRKKSFRGKGVELCGLNMETKTPNSSMEK